MSEKQQTCELACQDGLKPRQILVATMPRSGTWYNNLFYTSYFSVLAGNTKWRAGLLDADLAGESGANWHFRINHMECPGFADWTGPLREAWDGLKCHAVPIFGDLTIDPESLEMLDPSVNQEVRIVYCYRNPLDQAVSAFQHSQKHTDMSKLLSIVEQNGVERLIEDTRDYLYSKGIYTYIRQFLTYKLMKKAYPDNLLLIKYEDLVRSPSLVFAQSLEFMGHPVNSVARQQAFSGALKFSSMESVKNIEKLMGHSIAGDQVDPEASHVSDGAIGKWKRFFNQNDLLRINERLAVFGMSLEEFTLD
jgi:hypothetical protein